MRIALGALAVALAWLGWSTWSLNKRLDDFDARTDKELDDLNRILADRALDVVRLVTAVQRLKQSVDRFTGQDVVIRSTFSRNGGTQC